MYKRIICVACAAFIFCVSYMEGICVNGKEAEDYLGILYRSMPLPDSLSHSRQWWTDNVGKTLEFRSLMDWNIPEREFEHFVLPLRVNNEELDDFRTEYADELCARVRGMSMYDAGLEINHWCHERVTYQPSDGRTSAPLSTIFRHTHPMNRLPSIRSV